MTITTNNFKGCPTASFSDLLASKLSHTDVVSSDIQHAMKSLFGNETVSKVTSGLISSNNEDSTPFYSGVNDMPEELGLTKLDWTNLKVKNNDSAHLLLNVSFGKKEAKPRCLIDFISEEFVFNATKEIFGKGLTLDTLSGCTTNLGEHDVDNVSYEFSISKLGILNTEHLIEKFFRNKDIENNNLLFEKIYTGITLKPSKITAEIPIFTEEHTQSTTIRTVIKELGAYQSIKASDPELSSDTIFNRILHSLVTLCEEILNSLSTESRKDVYPIFMRRMLLSQFQY
jgi:hypothetical protein